MTGHELLYIYPTHAAECLCVPCQTMHSLRAQKAELLAALQVARPYLSQGHILLCSGDSSRCDACADSDIVDAAIAAAKKEEA